MKPLCYDCLSEDVAVKLVDLCGIERWFCADDWAAEQAFHDKFTDMLEKYVAPVGGREELSEEKQ